MQASPASNETRLPRAVLRRSAAIAERLAAQAESKNPDTAAPPIEATADPVDTPPPPPPPPIEDPRHSDPEYWKQRFKVLEGRLRVREDEHRAAVTGLNQRIADLQALVQTLQADASSAPPDLKKFLTQEQIDTLGEEEATAIVTTATKAAREAAQQVVETQVTPLHEERRTEQARLVEDRKRAFVDALVELVPDFEEIDPTPEFGDWLQQKDPVSKVQWQVLLDIYVREGDAVSTAAVFTAFKQSRRPADPPVTPRGSAVSGDGPTPPASSGLVGLTGAEIKSYYKRAALGKVKDEERVAFEARLKLPRR